MIRILDKTKVQTKKKFLGLGLDIFSCLGTMGLDKSSKTNQALSLKNIN